MIVAVKRNRKQKIIKFFSIIFLLLMFGSYYLYMSNEYEQKQKIELEQKQAQKLMEEKKEEEKKFFERTILKEIEKTVDLLGQEHIKHIKIVENKILIVCELQTNLEPLTVRYGATALVKRTLNELIIAIDIDYIIKSKMNVS